MGFEAHGQNAQFLPELPAFRAWEHTGSYDQEHVLKTKPVLAALAAGSTTYTSATDSDLQSVYSDDNISVADSVFDNVSVASSQSSYGSSGSDSSEDSSDGEHVPAVRIRQTSAIKEINKKHESHPELLSGIGSESLPLRFNTNKGNNTQYDFPPAQNAGPGYSGIGNPEDTPLQPQLRQQTTFKQPPCMPQKTNRRRSIGFENSAPPCRLKRDTDSSDCFVAMLVTFAAKLITAIWPLSACPPMMSSCFNGAGVLPLETFINETLRRSKTSYSTLQVALWYLMLLKCQLPNTDFTKEQGQSTCRAMQCGRRMFLAALMLASKYLQDRNYSTRAWSKISGLRVCEINENEMKYLQAIDYKLHITKEAFDQWSRVVLTLSKVSKLKPGSFPQSQLRKGLSGCTPGLAQMVDLDHVLNESNVFFSDKWWHGIFASLEPNICNSDASTCQFLQKMCPWFDLSQPFLRMEQGMTGTFGSAPERAQSNFGSSAAQPSSSDNSTPQGMDGRGQSMASLPLRPHLRNLPTPVSTPRGAEGYLPTPSGLNLRCSASVDALRNIRKQCLTNANLERCPPPRPQSYHAPPLSRMRPAASIPCQLPSPFTSSPLTSDGTDNGSVGGRSRSSSISSNSSWSSGPTNVQNTSYGRPDKIFNQVSEPSPLTRVVSMPETRLNLPPGHKFPSIRRMQPVHDIAAARRHAAAANSSGVAKGEGRNLLQEEDAAAALLRLYAGRQETQQQMLRAAQQTIAQFDASPRGHKRNLSHAESLHENVRSLLQQESDGDEVMSDSPMKIHNSTLRIEKKWQMPARNWALPKKPVDTFDHKRIALYCTPTAQLSAPELTAMQLKEQLVSV